MAQPSSEKKPSVYLYIPNIIGYFRIIINFIAFAVCYSHRALFAILYFFSFFCDGLDGWFARKFNQVKNLGLSHSLSDHLMPFYVSASTFGAVLDMGNILQSELILVFALHFLRVSTACLLALLSQFYSSFLSGKTSHKDVKDTGNWLLKLYYGHRPFMAFCCVASEVCRGLLHQSPLIVFVFISTLVGWALKQVINVIQVSKDNYKISCRYRSLCICKY
uniref:CDP-diacylglycerol--inositol 3-phosphatidyltransferase n=1 Tax=Leersia perrieri TaxID=77586 RepID=A0A0D9VBK8_9ORYZ